MNAKKAAFLLVVLLSAAAGVRAATLTLSARSVEAPGWRAQGIELYYAPPDVVDVRVAAITVPGHAPLEKLEVRCHQLDDGQGLRCDHAPFTITLPGWGKVSGRLSAHYRDAQHWRASIEVPSRTLNATLDQSAQALKISLRLGQQPAAGLMQLLSGVSGLKQLGEASAGTLGARIDAQLGAALNLKAVIETRALTWADPSGSYATDKLTAHASIHWQGASGQAAITLASSSGQAYVDPVFLDFDAQALQAEASLKKLGDGGWDIAQLSAKQGNAGTVQINGRIGKDYKPQQLDVRVDAQDLAPLVSTGLQPFLIGSKLEGLSASGSGRITLALRDSAPHALTATLKDAGLKADKLGLSFDGVNGELHWGAQPGEDSRLSWRSGAIKRVPLEASALSFRTHARDFELLSPWRQPLLQGALKVEKMQLRDIGGAGQSAVLEAALEPLDLAALCRALDWPEFGGTLAGKLPGLTMHDDVWELHGALEAQAFDGRLRINQLRAIQPLGALPRVTADIEIRNLDLERLTSAFSFGRITGRLDGDVKSLRLLDWSPVAFDGRIYSTPGDESSRRISQRAIDNISSIGGGPTGILSRGFLRVFDDFAYSRLGLQCVLRDGVCHMSGIEPTKSRDGRKAYTIVKGRLLPRIDVVGYAERVSWNSLLQQLQAARASAGPQVGGDKPKDATE